MLNAPSASPPASILAPLGRDALIIRQLLADAGIASVLHSCLSDLTASLSEETGFVVIADEELFSADLREVARWVAAQPTWSDLPIIVLTKHADDQRSDGNARRLPALLGNVTFIERPFHPETFVSLARTAYAGRLRQYRERARIEELRASEERFRALVTASSDVIYRMNADWSEMKRLEGPGVYAGKSMPRRDWIQRYVHPDDIEHVLAAVRTAVSTRSVFELEHRVRRSDGSPGWTLSRAVPITNSAGEIVEWFGAAADVTPRKEAEARLHRSEEQYRILFDSIDEGFCTVQVEFDDQDHPTDYRFIQVNPAFERQTGLRDAVGQRIKEMVPDLEQYWYDIYGRIALNGQPERFEQRAKALDRWFDVFAFRFGPAAARTVAILFRDVSDRKRAEETQRLLLGELNHRVKNTLASVQSIVQMTLRQSRDPDVFAKAFAGRVQSLARVHSILTDSTWVGADFQTLVRDQLLSGVVEEVRLTTSGPTVMLPPQVALHAALMLHELGTNAAKYGAVSVPGGSIKVEWSLSHDVLEIKWTERNGPVVTALSHTGFGTTLIQRTAQSNGGEAHMTFEEAGVTWRIRLPLGRRPELDDGNIDQRPRGNEMRSGENSSYRLNGRRLLIVEDEPMVAMDNAAELEAAGAVVVGLVGNVNDALRLIQSSELDGVLLDANLNGQPVDRIAEVLTRRNIPFIFVSGYGRANLPKDFADVPLLGKPFHQEQLIKAISEILVPAS